MRKIPSELESPLDDWVLKFADKSGIMECFHNMGLTPNVLTTIGNLSRVASIYFLVNGKKNLFILFALIGFMFDCFDGHYARKYNMTTVFGDYFDHIGDLVYHFVLLYLIFTSTKFQALPQRSKYVVYGVMALATYLFIMHMGCQEHFFECDEKEGNCSHTLHFCKCVCPNRDYIHWTKFFGTGTFVLLIYLLAYLYI